MNLTPQSQISLHLTYFCSLNQFFFCHATIKIAYLNSKTNLYYRLVQYENFISNNLEDMVWNMNLTPQIPISVHLTILQVLGIYKNKTFLTCKPNFAASGHLNKTFLTCKPSKLFTLKTKLIYTKDCFKMSPLLLIC